MDTRLIIDEPARGSWNMAVDETLLQWAGQHRGSALRFYQWDQPTLSLGYFQQLEARGAHPPSATLPVVRRTTGGGAIVHDRELTYSFVTPTRNRFSSSAQDFVKQFHESLIATLAAYGIEATLWGDAVVETKPEPFLCFQRRSSLDILVGDAKVAGSAQRRHQAALLQHGSILLARSPNAAALPGLAELAGTTVSVRELVEEWSQSLGKQFGFEFAPSALTEAESSVATSIERARFSHQLWTRKR
ncbi:MAG: lipoate--protein ligase family protein [Planctomycetota bacterium]|nr:lipoate--protein ligase family protein [Planctomycetota bacterium]